MNAKFTPGPWQLGRLGKKTQHVDGLGWTSFCKVYVTVGSREDTEGRANARLIAAAPEMFAALEDAEFLLRKAGQIAGPMQDSFNRSAQDARAAIAKARGEA